MLKSAQISKFLNFQLLKMPWFIGGEKKSEFLNSTRPCLSALEFLKKNSNFHLTIVSTALFAHTSFLGEKNQKKKIKYS